MNLFKNYYQKLIAKKRLWRVILILFIILLLAWFLSGQTETIEVKSETCVFQTELARQKTEQYKGLSDRKEMSENKGMLFLFPDKKDRAFVMRNMNFPLDIIFISEGRVVNLFRDLPPEGDNPSHSYHSGAPVDAVLEINAGLSRHCGIGVGSLVKW